MTQMSATHRFAIAEVIAVGSELLSAHRPETNSLTVTARLEELGIQVRAKTVVGDDPAMLTEVFSQARARADVVVLTGGLGPTEDDLTREVVAAALGRPLDEDPVILETIRRRFASRQVRMPDVNRRQAMVPQGAWVIPNPNGTAPGLWIDEGNRGVLLLPGPPRELAPMIEAFARDVLGARVGAERLYRRALWITGRTESQVEELTQPLYSAWRDLDPPITTTILSTPGQIELHFVVRTGEEAFARERLDDCERVIAGVLGDSIFSTDGSPLEAVVGALLRERGLTIAVAESCTGGLIASRLTDVAGSSAYLQAGVVAYSNRAKHELLGVPDALLEEYGAVSEPVAQAMADGARQCGHADIGVGVTGIAGPAGSTPAKPVGTVCLAVRGPGPGSLTRTVLFPGRRALVKSQASQAALDVVRRALLAK